MSKKFIIFIIILLSLMSFTVYDYLCINLPITPYNYANIEFPSDVVNNLSSMDNTPSNNPTTDAGATLGRVLFYDVDLSFNHTVSCSSCHIQEFSFTDTARFSEGFNGGLTGRNSMGLIHARFQKDSSFFWDNRAASLEIQTLMPIQNGVEMGLTLDTLVARVSGKSFYPNLFQSAFGDPAVSSDRISKALAQFIRSMNTFGSRFRSEIETTTGNPSIVHFPNFTAQENLGKDLFMDEKRGNCQACHTRNVMVPQGSKNIGLDLVYTDNGVGAAYNNPQKNGEFSVPSLINVALTAPYMHDGRFKTLEQVINHYSDSVKNHPILSGFLRDTFPGVPNPDPNNNPCNSCPPRKPHFSDTEKQALIAFLNTLTDTIITKDVRWSNPFCERSLLSVKFADPIKAYNISEGIEVIWGTATEINCDRFEVERSTDGVHFDKINQVQSVGNSSIYHLYKIQDRIPFTGINFYRIKEVDLDNKHTYSKIVTSDYNSSSVSVYPNPTKDYINIQSKILIKNIRILNASGKILKSINSPSKIVSLLEFPFGEYYLQIVDSNNQVYTRKISKR